MFEKEILKYTKLNTLAKEGATIIFGTGTDTELPISEITAAFDIDTTFYNRSIQEISVTDAVSYYNAIIAPLSPKRIILHIGNSDIELFAKNPSAFDTAYRELINCIRSANKKCNIGLISLKNPQKDNRIKELNRHLRMLAESEKCEFEDISIPRVWNPTSIKSAMSFASAMGLSAKIKNNKSLYDIAKMFFYYDAA